jgi:hypothetical protein
VLQSERPVQAIARYQQNARLAKHALTGHQLDGEGRLPDILVLIDAMSGAEVYPVWSAQPGAQ